MKLFSPITLLITGTIATAQVPTNSTPDRSRSANLPVESRAAYLYAMKKRIAINAKARCPFGLSQDLSKPQSPHGPQGPLPPERPDRFAELVQSIQITAVNPRNRAFLVEARTFREGDEFALVSGTYRAHLGIERVTSRAVTFRNVDSGQLATRLLHLDPREEIQRNSSTLPDGVDRSAPNAIPALHLPVREPSLSTPLR